MKEERQAHAKATQQQLDKHAVELQDGQQRTAGAAPTAPITPVEDRVQVLSLTSPPAFSLLCLTQLCLPQSMSPIEQVLASPRLKFAAAIH